MRASRWGAVLVVMALGAGAILAGGKTEISPGRKPPGRESARAEEHRRQEQDEAAARRGLHGRPEGLIATAPGRHYGNVPRELERAPGTIHTPVGSFRLGEGPPDLPANLRAARGFGGAKARYFYVQFDPDQVDTASVSRLHRLIESNGGAVLRRVPVSAVLARLTPRAIAAVSGLPGLMAIEPYHPAFKIAPYVGRLPLADAGRAASEIWNPTSTSGPG